MKAEKNKRLGRVLKEQMRTNRRVFILWAVLRLFVIAAMILSTVRGYYDNVFLCLLVLVLFLLPALQRCTKGTL